MHVQRTDQEHEIDVAKTFESGSLYGWWHTNGWYETTVGEGFLRVRDDRDGMVYESEGVGEEAVERFLGLYDSLKEVQESVSGNPPVERTFEKHRGLRIPRGDPFASVVSFIASAQSNNQRTRSVIRRLCERHGDTRDGWKAYTFPSPEKVAALSEGELRELGFGYRAPYITETAEVVADGGVEFDRLREEPYREAHSELKRLKGVGDKVADCVLLFSLGFLSVVALDTWLRRIIDEKFSHLQRDGYEGTARAFREEFGEYAGYVQTYLYHEARTGDGSILNL